MVVLLIVGFMLVVAFEVPGLIRKGYWRELAAFSILLSIGLVLLLLVVIGVTLPPIATSITNLFKSVIPGFYKAIKM